MISNNHPIGGFINIYKKENMTSVGTTNPLKKILKNTKIGHIGTLDPAAQGVLPVALGKATKLIDFILKENKVYRAIIIFGIETDTLDLTGKIIKEQNANHLTKKIIEDELRSFTGYILQVPPIFSAIKIDGKRSYELARNGEHPILKERKINVKNVRIINFINNSNNIQADIEIECSSGFYVRSFARDLGKACKTVACLKSLKRTSVATFTEGNAYSIEFIKKNAMKINNYIIPMQNLLKFPIITLNDEESQKIINGNYIENQKKFTDSQKDMQGQYLSCFNKNNQLISIAKLDINNQLIKPHRVLV